MDGFQFTELKLNVRGDEVLSPSNPTLCPWLAVISDYGLSYHKRLCSSLKVKTFRDKDLYCEGQHRSSPTRRQGKGIPTFLPSERN